MSDSARFAIDHTFTDPTLLRQALTHRSFGVPHNERLEFIGDAVLNCVVAVALYERFPHFAEGDLSRARANLVNRDMLAQLARRLELGAELRLGDGESKSGGAERASILADALEAVIGAIFVDGGFAAARAAVDSVYAGVLTDTDPATLSKDPKTRLQEWLQARKFPVPEYAVVATAGEAHSQQFTVACRIPALGLITQGVGSSRRAAEQDAASAAYAEVMKGAARE